jgi:predicted ArsR family transcriptional regulator
VATLADSDAARLDRLGDVFGDGTRRAIFRHVLDADQPLSAAEVAAAFGLHRTVARAHLERMVEVGLVQFGLRRRAAGGRPAKVYSPGDERLEMLVPARRYEPLARLLLRLVAETTPEPRAVEAAVTAGREYGVGISHAAAGDAADAARPMTPAEAAAWLSGAGYRTRLDDGGSGVVTLDVTNCVYKELAVEYPDVVCAFDRGMFCGMLGATAEEHKQTHSLIAGDGFCRHHFRR